MTTPSWTALADDAIRRLQHPGAEAARPKIEIDPDPLAWRDDPQAGRMSLAEALAASPAAMTLPFDEQREIAMAGGDPCTAARENGAGRPDTPPQPSLPADRLLLALQLCRAFGSAAAIEAMTRPRAITVLDHGDAPEDAVRELLDQALLPRGTRCAIGWEHREVDPAALCVLALKPGAMDGWNRLRLDRDLAKLLASDAPILILVPDSDLPEHWLRVLPAPVTLTPVDREILLALLRVTHPDATGTDTDALHERLPNDASLATLSLPAILIALRQPTPSAVADQLAAMLPPQQPTPAVAKGPTLDDIEGYGEAERVARRMVADLQAWEGGEVAWSEVQRSLLLHGEPGTGKTFLAAAMANSAGIDMVRGGFAQWQAAGHLGHMLSALRRTFADARAAAPAILVIDEIDSVGSRMSHDRHNENYRRQVINGFLEELDGLVRMEGVLLVGTCNHPAAIDPAVLRPGRFDIQVEVPRPGRAAVTRMLRDGYPGALAAEDLARLSRAATGHTAAAVDGALRGARAVARAERRPVQPDDVLAVLGMHRDQDPAIGYRTAVHECGHAIVAAALGVSEVRRVLLTPSGGETWTAPRPRQGLLVEFEADLVRSMAGRAAERLILGDVSSGAGGPASSDLAMATGLAMQIDLQLGLGAEGPLWFGPDPRHLAVSGNAARARRRLGEAEERATDILSRNRPLLEGMAAALLEAGLLEGEELAIWIARIAQ